MPYGPIFLKSKESLLSYEELMRVINAFSKLGVKKIRFTGGEPLIRNDFSLLLKKVSDIKRISSLGLTTNGYYLHNFIKLFLSITKPLSINVSLDTLNKEKFRRITGVDALERVTENIKIATRNGLSMKINTVVLKGVNEDEITDIVLWGADKGLYGVRFIELMSFKPRGRKGRNVVNLVVDGKKILSILSERFSLTPLKTNGKTEEFMVKETGTRVGVISSNSQRGCVNCSKLRLTPEGKILFCLKSPLYIDLRYILSMADEVLLDRLKAVMMHKRNVPKEREIPSYGMNLIGG